MGFPKLDKRRVAYLGLGFLGFTLAVELVLYLAHPDHGGHGYELAWGVALPVALGLVFWQIFSRQALVEDMVASRTRALHQAESRLAALFQGSVEGILILDADSGLIVDANPAVCALLGYSKEELLGLHQSDLHTPDSGTEAGELLKAALTQPQASFKEVRFSRKDGSPLVADVNCVQMQIEGQRWVAGLISDASERLDTKLQLEAEVRRRTYQLGLSEARSRAIHRAMLDGMALIDARGVIQIANDALHTMFGYERDELVGRNISVLMPEPHRSAHDGYLTRYLQNRHVRILGQRNVELTGVRHDGSLFPIDLTVNEIVDDRGSSFIGILRDITEQKAARQVLEKALDEAQAATRTKSAFLANMSHEIRTPINAILGFAHLCQKTDLNARQADYVAKIEAATESLLGIVNDVLDFSKIEAGKLELERIPFNLDEVLAKVSGLFSLKAREKGLEFAFGALPGVPNRLLGDPLRLAQVLTNLVGNALKFTEKGEIALTVEPVPPSASEADSVSLRFSVRDTGLGMTAAQQERLFSAFSQADSSTTRKFGGTGLGLAISKQLVGQMGGEIGVESAPGQGSRFSFTARFGVAEGQQAARALLAGKRLLVVDDNKVMRNLLARTVAAFGCEAETADSGEAALAQLTAMARPDAILMDWRLPGMDGLDTARQIRRQGMGMPIVLITGDELDMARSQVEKDVVQAYLGKPVSRAALQDTLTQLLGGVASLPEPPKAVAATPNLSGRNILVVDDNEFNRQVARELIELSGASVDMAENGLEAVQKAVGGKYHLVLMDIQMPVMDGYSAAHALRTRFPDLPIVALTAHAMAEERTRVLAVGMNDILTKPIRPDALDAALVRWLGGESTVPVVEKPVEKPEEVAPAPLEVEKPAPLPLDAGRVLDVDAGLVTAKGNRAFYGRLLQMFLANPSADMAALRLALAGGDRVASCRQAHTLKSLAASIGAHGLADAAKALESALAGAAQEGEGGLLEQMETALTAARSAAEAHLAKAA